MKFLVLSAFLSLPVLADVAVPPDLQPVAQTAPAPAPVHPQGIEKVPMGVIEGGWAYVYAAYGAGLLGLIAYTASLFLRRSEAPPPGDP